MSISELEFWRLSDELSVVDVALLATGHDPGKVRPFGPDPASCPIESIQEDNQYGRAEIDDQGFRAVFKGLKGAIYRNKIAANFRYKARLQREYISDLSNYPESKSGNETAFPYELMLETPANSRRLFFGGTENIDSTEILHIIRDPDWHETTLVVDDVTAWFSSRSVYPAFFFPDGKAEGFRNRHHPRYSPKLACAVAAWEAVEHPQPKKSVKQSVEAWVTGNGVNYGLAGEDGTVSPTAAGEIAKVANWNRKGGATPTLSQAADEPKRIENYIERTGFRTDLDDEIPF